MPSASRGTSKPRTAPLGSATSIRGNEPKRAGCCSRQRHRIRVVRRDGVPELPAVGRDVGLVPGAHAERGAEAAGGDELVDVTEDVVDAVVPIASGLATSC